VWEEISSKIWPTVLLVGVGSLAVGGVRDHRRIIAAWRRGSLADYSITSSTMVFYSMPDFWLGMLLLVGFAVVVPWFPTGGMEDLGADLTGFAAILDRLHHLALPCLTLTLAYLGEYAIVMRSSMLEVMGEDYLTVARRAKGLRRRPGAQHPCGPELAPAGRHPRSDQPRVRAVRCDRGRDHLLVAGLGKATSDAIRGPDLPMLQGLFLVFSAAVILFNLLADLLYAFLDPRVRPT